MTGPRLSSLPLVPEDAHQREGLLRLCSEHSDLVADFDAGRLGQGGIDHDLVGGAGRAPSRSSRPADFPVQLPPKRGGPKVATTLPLAADDAGTVGLHIADGLGDTGCPAHGGEVGGGEHARDRLTRPFRTHRWPGRQ